MGLIKEIETEQGILTTYHNINMYKNTADGYLEITVNSYINREKRDNGKVPVKRENMVVPKEYWQNEGSEERLEMAGYTYLKTLPKFEGATDD